MAGVVLLPAPNLLQVPTTALFVASSSFNSGVLGSMSAYTQITASTSRAFSFLDFSFTLDATLGSGSAGLEIAKGGAGSETMIASYTYTSYGGVDFFQNVIVYSLPVGTRLAIRARQAAAGATVVSYAVTGFGV